MNGTWWALGLALATGLAALGDLVAAREGARARHRRLADGGLRAGTRRPIATDRLARTAPVRRLGTGLAAAGLDVGPVPFLAAAGATVLALALVVATTTSAALALPTALGGVVALRGWLRHRAEQRRDELTAQLPELARLLANAAGAGLALRSGLELAAREIAEPARTELEHVVASLAVGDPLERALGDLAHRLPSREVAVLVTTLVVQQQAGGRTITALRALAVALEARKEVRREVRTLVAGAVSSTHLVLGMGIGSVLLLELATPGVVDGLVGTAPGRAALATSAGLDLLGLAAIRRLTRIDA